MSLTFVEDSEETALLIGSIRTRAEGQRSGSDQELSSTSKFRRIASQLCGVLASDCLRFTTSSFTGFHIILIAELHRTDSPIPITLDQLTWFASLYFPNIIGSVVNGFVTQRLGSRVVMLTSTLLFMTSWLLYYYATSATMLLASRMIYSVTSGAVKTPSSTYITEISQPHLRGSFLASSHLAATFGAFFSLLLASMIDWRTITLVNLIFPVVTAIVIFMTPDSPVWLASKGRYNDAQMALSWLRGWAKPIDVQAEYRILIENVQRSQSTATATASVNNQPHDEKAQSFRERWKELFKAYLQRSFYLPLATISLIFALHFSSGVGAMPTYSGVIFSKMNSPFRESIATAAMGATRIIGAFIILFFIKYTGKRKLVFFSLSVAGLCHVLIAIMGFLDVQADYSWISPIAMIIAIFANASGVETIVHMLNSEIFPASMRYIGSSIGSSVSAIMSSIVNKLFLYMVDAITLSGVFLFFAVVNAVAVVAYYFVFPETEGRSLKEIEEHFIGIRRLSQPKK